MPPGRGDEEHLPGLHGDLQGRGPREQRMPAQIGMLDVDGAEVQVHPELAAGVVHEVGLPGRDQDDPLLPRDLREQVVRRVEVERGDGAGRSHPERRLEPHPPGQRPRDDGGDPHVLLGRADVVQKTRRRLQDGVLCQVVVARVPAGCLDAVEEFAQGHRLPLDALEVVGRIVARAISVPDLDPDFDLRQRSLEVRGVPARDRLPAVGDARDDHRPAPR